MFRPYAIGLLGLGCWLSSCGSTDASSSVQPPSYAPKPSTAQQGASGQPSTLSSTVGGAAGTTVHSTVITAGTGALAGADVDAGVAQPDGGSAASSSVRCQADESAPQKVDYSKVGPYRVATVDMNFQDTSRAIAQTDKHPAASSRQLPTTIYYPAAAKVFNLHTAQSVSEGGPFPMLMYSHGYSSSRNEAVPVANQLASYGFIVVVPEFPLTNGAANGGKPDVMDAANQPGDVSYLIDQMLAESASPSSTFAHAIDETRIGTLGLSLGGLTTWLVTFHPKLHDERIRVAMPIAGLSSFFAQGFYHTREIPTLILHGDLDAFINYEFNGRRAFMRAAPNTRLVTIKRGTHAAFGTQLDANTTQLLNGAIAPKGADPTNPDGLGCGAVGSTLQMTDPKFVDTFGTAADFIAPDPNPAATVPCVGDEYKHPAIDATAQEQIAKTSAAAFFIAHLAKTAEERADGCRYLVYELPKNQDLTLE